MTRFASWPQLLEQFLSTNGRREFSYGSWDCCLFVCECVRVMTGTDPGESFRGRYSNRASAFGEIERHGCARSVASVAGLMARQLGMERIEPLKSGRGDVVLLKNKRAWTLGIVALNGREVLVVGERGLQEVSLRLAVCGWRV